MKYGRDVPLLVNVQPAGKYLGERFHRAGGVPAVLCELLRAGRIAGDVLTVTGRTLAENIAGRESIDREVITAFESPLQEHAGFLVLHGNLFDFAIMKTSVISADFRRRFPARDRASKGAPWCSMALATITRASMTRRSASTNARSSSSAGQGRSVGRAQRKS